MRTDPKLNRRGRYDQLAIAAFVAGSIALGGLASPATEAVRIFGYSLPPLCVFKAASGLDCPGCGLTRAVILALHGQFSSAYRMHIWGIPLAGILLWQIPYRLALVAWNRHHLLEYPAAWRRWISHAVVLSLLVPWIIKTGPTAIARLIELVSKAG